MHDADGAVTAGQADAAALAGGDGSGVAGAVVGGRDGGREALAAHIGMLLLLVPGGEVRGGEHAHGALLLRTGEGGARGGGDGGGAHGGRAEGWDVGGEEARVWLLFLLLLLHRGRERHGWDGAAGLHGHHLLHPLHLDLHHLLHLLHGRGVLAGHRHHHAGRKRHPASRCDGVAVAALGVGTAATQGTRAFFAGDDADETAVWERVGWGRAGGRHAVDGGGGAGEVFAVGRVHDAGSVVWVFGQVAGEGWEGAAWAGTTDDRARGCDRGRCRVRFTLIADVGGG